MSKARQIIKLDSQGIGKKKISIRLGMSKNTVKLYIDQFFNLKKTSNELCALTDFEQHQALVTGLSTSVFLIKYVLSRK